MPRHNASDASVDKFFERFQLGLIQLGTTFVDDGETKMRVDVCVTMPWEVFCGWCDTTLCKAITNRLRKSCNLCGV
jgi:hypothetical protein